MAADPLPATAIPGLVRQVLGPPIGQPFIDRSRRYLSAEYLPKIRRCLGAIPDQELWWRPGPRSNSIGNLMLHLAGNIRQWIGSWRS
jgi:hypothetical protein